VEKFDYQWVKKKKQLVVPNTFCNVYKSLFRSQGKKNFDQFFDKSVIDRIGGSSGFVQRKAQKISAYYYVLGFLIMCAKGKNTYAEWAVQVGLISGKLVSRQAMCDRMTPRAASFAEALLKTVLAKICGKFKIDSQLLAPFGRVLLQDSTVLKLPDSLSEQFPGNTSRGEKKSQVRIQTILNLTSFRFLHFGLSGFTKNDQSSSGEILTYARKGDLVIRDLGYFSLATFAEMLDRGVHFLSRLKFGVTIKTPEGKQLDLSKLLKRKNTVDIKVLLGNQQVPVRLIMIPLPEAIANERIRKAKCDRDRRLNHSAQYYLWQRYAVFITSVDQQTWTAKQAHEVYKIRWQIEMVFKSWKSGAGLTTILHEQVANAERVKTVLYLFLLFICLVTEKIINPVIHRIRSKGEVQLSIIKAINFIMRNFTEVISCSTAALTKLMQRHCCYDKRKDRRTLTDLILNLA
jgi:Transposase DDE domain